MSNDDKHQEEQQRAFDASLFTHRLLQLVEDSDKGAIEDLLGNELNPYLKGLMERNMEKKGDGDGDAKRDKKEEKRCRKAVRQMAKEKLFSSLKNSPMILKMRRGVEAMQHDGEVVTTCYDNIFGKYSENETSSETFHELRDLLKENEAKQSELKGMVFEKMDTLVRHTKMAIEQYLESWKNDEDEYGVSWEFKICIDFESKDYENIVRNMRHFRRETEDGSYSTDDDDDDVKSEEEANDKKKQRTDK